MYILYLIITAILVNLVVPQIFKPFATEEQIKPLDGAANLPFIGQLMHMFVHHTQVPFSSSIIVAIIVVASYYIANFLDGYFNSTL